MENRRKEPRIRRWRNVKWTTNTANQFMWHYISLHSFCVCSTFFSIQQQSVSFKRSSLFPLRKKREEQKRRLLYLSMTLSPKKKRICHHNLAALHLKYFVGTINKRGNRFFLLFKSFKQCEIIWPRKAIIWILFRMYVSTSQSIKINLISILSPGKGSISNGSYFKFKSKLNF